MHADDIKTTPITIKSHDLHADDIRGVVGEIASYHEKGTSFLPTLVPALITIRSHNLHADDIRGIVDETASYHERNQLSPYFDSCSYYY